MALSVVVNVEEGSEMTIARGDRGMEPVDELGVFVKSKMRNYSNDNPDYPLRHQGGGAPRIVKLLKRYEIMASWTVAAMSLENHPEIRGGHRRAWPRTRQPRLSLGPPVQDGRGAGARLHPPRCRQHTMCDLRACALMAGCRRYLLTTTPAGLLSEEGFTYHMDDYFGRRAVLGSRDCAGQADVHRPLPARQQRHEDVDRSGADPAPVARLRPRTKFFRPALIARGEEGNPTQMDEGLGLHLRIIGRPGRKSGHSRNSSATVRAHEGVGLVWVGRPRKAIADHFIAAHSRIEPAPDPRGRGGALLLIDRSGQSAMPSTCRWWEALPALVAEAVADPAAKVLEVRAAEPGSAFCAGSGHPRIARQQGMTLAMARGQSGC